MKAPHVEAARSLDDVESVRLCKTLCDNRLVAHAPGHGADLRDYEGQSRTMTEERGTHDTNPRYDEHAVAEVMAAREEYAEEEAAAAEIEAAENAAALDVAFSLRLTKELDTQLRRRAAAEQVSPSALVRRVLREALQGDGGQVLTVEQVEQIARRVLRESA